MHSLCVGMIPHLNPSITEETMRNLYPILCLLLLLSTSRIGHAQQRLALTSVTDEAGHELMVAYHPVTGSAHRVYNVPLKIQDHGFNFDKLNRRRIEQFSRILFRQYKDLLGLRSGKPMVKKISTNGKFWFVSYVQSFNGLPVHGTQIGYTIDRTGRIILLGADVYPEADVNLSAPSITAAQAEEIAATVHSPYSANTPALSVEMVLYPMSETAPFTLRKAWKVTHQRAHTLVDAEDGTVLALLERPKHAYEAGSAMHTPPLENVDHRSATKAVGEASVVPQGAAGCYTVQGQLTADYWPKTPNDTPVTGPLELVTVVLANSLGQQLSSHAIVSWYSL